MTDDEGWKLLLSIYIWPPYIMSPSLGVEPSIPICCALAATGGILEVFATAMLAYPAARMLEGAEWTDKQLKGCLAANIILQILASLAGNLFATWYGPVAIVGPIFFAAQLLANLIVFWIVLGLESFSREMQIGTYVIVISVILLIVNGPGSQEYTATFEDLIGEIYAAAWAIILLICMFLSAVALIPTMDLHTKKEWFRYLVLLTARASAFALNLSTGKALVLQNDKTWLIVNICIKVISGAIYTRAIVVQSTAVQQKIFVPLNAAFIMLVNAITGIIIWEDWRTVQSWVGYGAVFLLLALGCGLLLSDLALIQESKPDTFLGARPSMMLKAERTKLLKNLKNFKRMSNIDFDLSESYKDDGVESSENQDDPLAPSPPRRISVGRKSRPPSIARFSSARFGRQGSERHRVAWASIYDASGATHSLVARISSQNLATDENRVESRSNDEEVTGVEESGDEKPSDTEIHTA